LQKKVKILRIQSRICIGGPAIHTEILSKYLNAEKYETILVGGALNNGEVSRIAELRQKGIHVQLIPEMGREISPLRDLFTIFKLYRLMQQEAPDIVHTHTAKAGAAGRIAACLARVPVIVHTFHGHVFHDYFGKLRTTLFIWLERILGTLTSSIITISPRQRFDIVEKYKIARPTKVKVIQLGFELERFLLLQKNVLLKNDLGLTQDEILIGIVGRLVPIKNHKMMLRVLEQLRQNGIKGHLCIVGDGELRNELELLAKEWRIQKYVHFLCQPRSPGSHLV
jgi:glycosyltransferase involved in cell wall biosynthesis